MIARPECFIERRQMQEPAFLGSPVWYRLSGKNSGIEEMWLKLPESPFQLVDWADEPATEHPGVTGVATWRTRMLGDVRVRLVEYSPGYVADHWCERGHVIFVIEGELTSELRDGRQFLLTRGMSYYVSDFGDSAHRSLTAVGARLFIVD
jgi:hypothetical protein